MDSITDVSIKNKKLATTYSVYPKYAMQLYDYFAFPLMQLKGISELPISLMH